MSTAFKILLLCNLFASAVSAQQADSAKGTPTKPVMGERDRASEDQIATLFERMRKDAKLPSLARIKYRDSMVQSLCTIMQTNPSPEHTYGLNKTSSLDLFTPELKRIASFNELHPRYNPSLRRYSVVVWRVTEPQSHESTYWIGIGFYPSAATEFLMNHFTDDLYYRNDWKKHITPECVGQ
jgi:hypothetical protein